MTSVHGTPLRATLIWIFLIGATAFAWAVGERADAGAFAMLALIVVAFLKGGLVILDYMALRHAPLLWRAFTLGWMFVVCSLIALAYWKGLSS